MIRTQRRRSLKNYDKEISRLCFTLNKKELSKDDLNYTRERIDCLKKKEKNHPLIRLLDASLLLKMNNIPAALAEFKKCKINRLYPFLTKEHQHLNLLFYNLTKTAVQYRSENSNSALKIMLASKQIDTPIIIAHINNELEGGADTLKIVKDMQVGPSEVAYYLIYALSFSKEKRFHDALRNIEEAIKLINKPDVHLKVVKIRILYGMNNYYDAKDYIVSLLKENGLSSDETFEVYMTYAEILLTEKNWLICRNILSCQTIQDVNSLQKALINIKLAESFLQEAWSSWEKEQVGKAKKLLEDALSLVPTNPDIYKLLGYVYFFSYEIARSMDYFEHYARISNNHSWVIDIAHLAIENSDTYQPIELYDFYSKYFTIYISTTVSENKINDQYLETLYLWSQMDILFGREKSAIDRITSILTLLTDKTKKVNFEKLLLKAILVTGNVPEIEKYVSSIEQSSDDDLRIFALIHKSGHSQLSPSEAYTLGLHYVRNEDYISAIKILSFYKYTNFSNERTDHELLLRINSLLAHCYYKNGMYALSRLQFEDSLTRLEPSNPEYKKLELSYARSLIMCDDEKAGLVINKYSGSLDAAELMVEREYRANNYDEVLNLVLQSSEHFILHKEYYFLTAEICYKKQDYKLARQFIRNALDQDPSNFTYLDLLQEIGAQQTLEYNNKGVIYHRANQNIISSNTIGMELLVTDSETPEYVKVSSYHDDWSYNKFSYPPVVQDFETILRESYEAAHQFCLNEGNSMDTTHIVISLSSKEYKYFTAFGLPIAIAIISAVMNLPINNKVALIGEVDAAGILKRTNHIGKFIQFATDKLHVKNIIIPKNNSDVYALLDPHVIITNTIECFNSLRDVIDKVLLKERRVL